MYVCARVCTCVYACVQPKRSVVCGPHVCVACPLTLNYLASAYATTFLALRGNLARPLGECVPPPPDTSCLLLNATSGSDGDRCSFVAAAGRFLFVFVPLGFARFGDMFVVAASYGRFRPAAFTPAVRAARNFRDDLEFPL